MFRIQLFCPVGDEALLFFEVELAFIGADNGAQGGGHLEGNEEEDAAPEDKVGRVFHPEYISGSEHHGDTEA